MTNQLQDRIRLESRKTNLQTEMTALREEITEKEKHLLPVKNKITECEKKKVKTLNEKKTAVAKAKQQVSPFIIFLLLGFVLLTNKSKIVWILSS